MASGGDVDLDAVIGQMKQFSLTSGCKNASEMNSKAHGKMVVDTLSAKYKKEDIRAICDASVFPCCKVPGKAHMELNRATVDKYLTKTAVEVAKRQTKKTKIDESAPEVQALKKEIADRIVASGPKMTCTKESKSGNVGGLTDSSKYTGAHKERFDASGKGKGIDGREARVENSGYVGNYKGDGTYSKKK